MTKNKIVKFNIYFLTGIKNGMYKLPIKTKVVRKEDLVEKKTC